KDGNGARKGYDDQIEDALNRQWISSPRSTRVPGLNHSRERAIFLLTPDRGDFPKCGIRGCHLRDAISSLQRVAGTIHEAAFTRVVGGGFRHGLHWGRPASSQTARQ